MISILHTILRGSRFLIFFLICINIFSNILIYIQPLYIGNLVGFFFIVWHHRCSILYYSVFFIHQQLTAQCFNQLLQPAAFPALCAQTPIISWTTHF